MAAAPVQHRAVTLDAAAPLGLFAAQLAAGYRAHHGQLKGQAVVALAALNALSYERLHANLGKSVNG